MAFQWLKVKILSDAFSLLLNQEFLADVKFQFPDGTTLFAHSFILCLWSPEFYGNFKQSIGVMKLILNDDIPSNTFLQFLKFLYTNTIDITSDNVADLLKLSMKYKINILENKCKCIMMNDVDPENACKWLLSSIQEKWTEIQKLILDFISNNFIAVLNSEAFLNVSENAFKLIIQMDPVSHVNEFDIFQCAIKWASDSCEKYGIAPNGNRQRQKFGENIKLIRFGAMDLEEFIKCLQIAPGLLDNNEISSIFMSISTKKSNSFGFSNQKRKMKGLLTESLDSLTSPTVSQLDFSKWSRTDFIDLNKLKWPRLLPTIKNNLVETFYIEFCVSNFVVLHSFDFRFGYDALIEYRIKQNGQVMQSKKTTLMKMNINRYKLTVQPLQLNPEKHYRFEYNIINTDLRFDFSVRKLQRSSALLSENHYVKFTTNEFNCHLNRIYLKCSIYVLMSIFIF